MRILPPGYDESYTYVIYTSTKERNILEANYTFWPIAFDDYGTYPLKSTQEAWQELIDGTGYVIKQGNNDPEKIVIRNVYLAYFDSKEEQNYLQPIFVFEGDNGFIAYVAAVSSQWQE